MIKTELFIRYLRINEFLLFIKIAHVFGRYFLKLLLFIIIIAIIYATYFIVWYNIGNIIVKNLMIKFYVKKAKIIKLIKKKIYINVVH